MVAAYVSCPLGEELGYKLLSLLHCFEKASEGTQSVNLVTLHALGENNTESQRSTNQAQPKR